ncbi:MAG TPA: Type 1 glutamine amidotransferase-like domain-containing protein [Acidimicrobiales bacterium]|nr:Type 1 glutamine amidotransferase-like domain-containing protein [Acidimicrobiales bacterium]
MTGTLAVVGGEPFTDACTFNRRLVEAAGATEVTVLPTAAAFEHPDRLVEAAKEHFGAIGVGVTALEVLTRADAMLQANADTVREASVVYLVGSSAMHARPTLLQTPVWDGLVAAWHAGATVIGSDAGAQILGDPMVDDRGAAFTVGLGLVERIAFVPRYATWSEDALQRLHQMTNPDLALIGLDDSTAAIRSPEGSWMAEGAGSVHVRVGTEPIELADLVR